MRALLAIVWFLGTVAWGFSPCCDGDEPQPAASRAGQTISTGQLRGSWRLLSIRHNGYPNLFDTLPPRRTEKHLTPTHVTQVTYDAEKRVAVSGFGGSYSLQEGQYRESVEYAFGPFVKEESKKHLRSYDVVIEQDRLRLTSKLSDGGTVEEIWLRIERTAEDSSPSP